mmetsp:Transcript_26580/g.71792  ORF Transcript_26580/g.71792 Transcript_26580/m.71792 type:complete len:203 (-) Transcript_26580:68-676(-)
MPARRSSSWHGSTTETCPTAHACSPPSMTQSPTGFPSPCAPRPTRRPWRPSLRRWGTLVRARFASLQETWSQTRSQRRTCTSSRQRRWTCSRASASSSRTRTSASARRSVPRWPAPSPSPSTPRTRTSPPQMPCGRTSALWISISCRSSWRLTRPNSCDVPALHRVSFTAHPQGLHIHRPCSSTRSTTTFLVRRVRDGSRMP